MQSILEQNSISFNPEDSISPQFLYDSDEDSALINSNHYNNDYSQINLLKKRGFDNPYINDSDSDSDSENIYVIKKSIIENEKISEITTKISKLEKFNNKIFEIAKVKKEKRVGRKRKGEHQNDEKTHTKYDKDNIHRKIQVHFIKFLFAFINDILMYFGIEQKFLGIDYKNKKVVTKDYVENLKTTEIGQILCKDISPKYQTLYNKNKDFNCKLYLKVIKNESIKNILSEKYINIFRNLYYKNKRDLNDYGLNIKLSNKVETYQDLLDRNNDDSEYIEEIKNLVKYCYLPQKFVTQK